MALVCPLSDGARCMKRVFCTLFVLAIAMVVGCGSGSSDKPLDDYAKALQPIEDKVDKLYERMNHDFDEVSAGMAASLNSSSQAEMAEALAKAQIFSDKMYNEWDTLLQRLVQITPPGELMEFHELYQEGFQLNHRAFFGLSSQITMLAATGQMNEAQATSISNDMLEADRKMSMAGAEWAKVQARYK